MQAQRHIHAKTISLQQFNIMLLFKFFLPKEVIKVKVEEVGDGGSQTFIINKDAGSVQRIGLCYSFIGV